MTSTGELPYISERAILYRGGPSRRSKERRIAVIRAAGRAAIAVNADAARQAGYTDDQIVDEVGKRFGWNVAENRRLLNANATEQQTRAPGREGDLYERLRRVPVRFIPSPAWTKDTIEMLQHHYME